MRVLPNVVITFIQFVRYTSSETLRALLCIINTHTSFLNAFAKALCSCRVLFSNLCARPRSNNAKFLFAVRFGTVELFRLKANSPFSAFSIVISPSAVRQMGHLPPPCHFIRQCTHAHIWIRVSERWRLADQLASLWVVVLPPSPAARWTRYVNGLRSKTTRREFCDVWRPAFIYVIIIEGRCVPSVDNVQW